VSTTRRPPLINERATLDPFDALTGSFAPRDQRDLMERPFFSLAKAKRLTPIRYKSGGVEVEVFAVPAYGMATIWDADILIWAASQIVEAMDRGLPTSRFLRFTPYQLLTATGRATGNRDYQLLKGALTRLQSTVVRTTIRHGEHWRRQQFSWINEWGECCLRSGRTEGMELVLPDWFFQGVLDRKLVLTIDPAYFALTGGFERWLYRVARKHAGRQPDGWRFDLHHLHTKSGSLARFSDFALQLRRVVARQPLPGYRLTLVRDDAARMALAIHPFLHRPPVDKLWISSADIGTSNASPNGTSHARSSGFRSQESQLTFWSQPNVAAPNDSNSDSNFVVLSRGDCAQRGGTPNSIPSKTEHTSRHTRRTSERE
jgi:plasmid replication initiation protein